MRSFSSFLRRRKVVDVSAWLKGNNVDSAEKLAAFCEAREMSVDVEQFREHFKTSVSTASKTRGPAEEQDDGAWHVPAAERPLKKTAAKTTTRRRRTTKKKVKEE